MLSFIQFEQDSDCKYIGENSFSRTSIKYFCIPEKVITVGNYAFSNCYFLLCLEGLSETFTFSELLFKNCDDLRIVSFPNACRIHNIKNVSSFNSDPKSIVFFVNANSVID